jgi:hypothetical protein
MFPLLAARFFKQEDVVDGNPPRVQAIVEVEPPPPKPFVGTLRTLDLQSLPRDVDGPPTEIRARKEKLAQFEKDCTHVGGSLFVSGEYVARNWEILSKSGISHVVNCVGFLYPPYFEKELSYLTLYLQDAPGEDILCVLYDVFDFINQASEASDTKNKVLIHCSQGVSRSTSFAIAYRMWQEDRTFDDVAQEVKRMRGISNPNIGFICQLLQWQKRRKEDALVPRLFRIASQCPSAPLYLVPKLPAKGLDPRGAFVLHAASVVYIWKGKKCPDEYVDAAYRFAKQLCRYENAKSPPLLVLQGGEDDTQQEFQLALSKATGECRGASEKASYDKDYEIFAKASQLQVGSTAVVVGGLGFDGFEECGARSARKTPRMELSLSLSPNDRVRKQQRSARSNYTSSSLSSESSGSLEFDGNHESPASHSPYTNCKEDPPHLPSLSVPTKTVVPRLALGLQSGSGLQSSVDSLLKSDSEENTECSSGVVDNSDRDTETESDFSEGSDGEDDGPGTSSVTDEERKKAAFVPRLNFRSAG